MRALVAIFALCSAVTLSGCASTITAWKNRGVASHTLVPGRFFTLTGERRLAFQAERYDPNKPPEPWYDRRNKRWVPRLAWCAESLPEVSQAVASSSKPNAKLSEHLVLGTDDAYSTTLTQTFNRTEIAEIYRQSAWQACQAWAQGVYSDDEYKSQLDKLLKAGEQIMVIRANQPIPAETSAAAAAAAAAARKKEEEEKARAAKKAKCAANPTKECVLDL